MCGKFTQMYSWREVHDFTSPLTLPSGLEETAPESILTATPMRNALVLRLNADGARELAPMRWGFSDLKAANPSRPKHMHARAETIDARPTFANAFRHGRGVLIVRTFNEGEELENGKTKQWVITPNDGKPLAIAVIFERWENGDQEFWTFVMVTVPPSPLIARVTDRMPAILSADDIPLWLGETGASDAEIKAALRTYDDAGAWSIAPQEPSKAKTAQAKNVKAKAPKSGE